MAKKTLKSVSVCNHSTPWFMNCLMGLYTPVCRMSHLLKTWQSPSKTGGIYFSYRLPTLTEKAIFKSLKSLGQAGLEVPVPTITGT